MGKKLVYLIYIRIYEYIYIRIVNGLVWEISSVAISI